MFYSRFCVLTAIVWMLVGVSSALGDPSPEAREFIPGKVAMMCTVYDGIPVNFKTYSGRFNEPDKDGIPSRGFSDKASGAESGGIAVWPACSDIEIASSDELEQLRTQMTEYSLLCSLPVGKDLPLWIFARPGTQIHFGPCKVIFESAPGGSCPPRAEQHEQHL